MPRFPPSGSASRWGQSSQAPIRRTSTLPLFSFQEANSTSPPSDRMAGRIDLRTASIRSLVPIPPFGTKCRHIACIGLPRRRRSYPVFRRRQPGAWVASPARRGEIRVFSRQPSRLGNSHVRNDPCPPARQRARILLCPRYAAASRVEGGADRGRERAARHTGHYRGRGDPHRTDPSDPCAPRSRTLPGGLARGGRGRGATSHRQHPGSAPRVGFAWPWEDRVADLPPGRRDC